MAHEDDPACAFARAVRRQRRFALADLIDQPVDEVVDRVLEVARRAIRRKDDGLDVHAIDERVRERVGKPLRQIIEAWRVRRVTSLANALASVPLKPWTQTRSRRLIVGAAGVARCAASIVASADGGDEAIECASKAGAIAAPSAALSFGTVLSTC